MIRYPNGVYKLKGNPWGTSNGWPNETEKNLKLEEGQAEFTEPTVSGRAQT